MIFLIVEMLFSVLVNYNALNCTELWISIKWSIKSSIKIQTWAVRSGEIYKHTQSSVGESAEEINNHIHDNMCFSDLSCSLV